MRDQIDRLLNQVGVLNHVCDLDLLIFFARHPRSLVSSESLAGLLGWDLKEIADSLEVLLSAGFLTRVQIPAHEARLYVFAANATTDGPASEWLPRLMAFASTREGRLALMQGLRHRRDDARSRIRSVGRLDTAARSE